MIDRFRDRATELVFAGKCPKGLPADLMCVARRKLEAVHAAVILDDLRAPPGNRLEARKGNRKGQHSIRINDQFRVCFLWGQHGAEVVEITDYH
jgi:proteic killer suppression protein